MKFVDLSQDFFRLLQSYLNNDDYHYLLNSSKQYFMRLKRKTIYFRLNKEKTNQYLTDKNFQSILLSKVENGWEQIHLRWDSFNVSRLYDPTVPSNGTGYTPTFTPTQVVLPDSTNPQMLKIIENMDKNEIAGNLSHVTKLHVLDPNIDLSLFKHIPNLMISGSQSNDFSMFNQEHQSRLTLLFCPLLTNVQSFQGIHTVKIANASLLEDISALHGIYDLSVVICPKVTDISVLGGHHRLEINCAYHLVGYESLRGIPNINLMGCDISDLTVLQDAKTIELKHCDKITNVAPIKNAKQIILYQNNHITNIEELSNVFDLSITESNLTLIEILNLKNHRLFIHFPTNGKNNNDNDAMENFVFFPNTSDLTLRYLPIAWLKKLEAGSMLFGRSLQSLTIDCANGCFQSIKGLESIPMVRLLDLTILDISGLSRNRCLDIRRCMGIANISSLADVTVLTLENGFGMFDCSGLSKIPRLKVFRA